MCAFDTIVSDAGNSLCSERKKQDWREAHPHFSSCFYFTELFICLAVSQKWRNKTANCKLTILQQAVITVLLRKDLTIP